MTPPLHFGNSVEEPLLSEYGATQSTPPSSTKPLLCLVSALMFISLCNFQLSSVSKFHIENEKINQGLVIQIGRKLLLENTVSLGDGGPEGGSRVGTSLGWAMAVIYMGGRLPQICLNRASKHGFNHSVGWVTNVDRFNCGGAMAMSMTPPTMAAPMAR